MNVPLLACSISIPFLAVKNKRYKITMGRRRSGSWCKQISIDRKSLMLYPCFSYCHRIGWWENFNRKPLKIWWYFNHGFRLRFSPTKPIHWYWGENSTRYQGFDLPAARGSQHFAIDLQVFALAERSTAALRARQGPMMWEIHGNPRKLLGKSSNIKLNGEFFHAHPCTHQQLD